MNSRLIDTKKALLPEGCKAFFILDFYMKDFVGNMICFK